MNSIFELRRYGIASHRRWVLLLILTVLLIPAKATPGTGGFGIGNSDAGSEETNNFVEAVDREISLSDSAASVSLNGNTLVIENADGTTTTQTLGPDEIVAVTTASGEDYLIDNSTSTVYTQASAGGSAPAGGEFFGAEPGLWQCFGIPGYFCGIGE